MFESLRRVVVVLLLVNNDVSVEVNAGLGGLLTTQISQNQKVFETSFDRSIRYFLLRLFNCIEAVDDME